LTYAYGQVTFAISPLIRGISLARKILLADDSVTAQNMGRKILADAGYEVIAVNNGSAALKKIAELKPDLVILDVYMPGYSGLEVCQRLKESPETARIPVLLTVGKLEPFKPEEAQRVRAEGFIVKPFEASELLATLSKLEDKVVPRPEPSKPGRFARAIAAAEESGRGGRNEALGTDSSDTGWKSRIGFPKQKTEPEEKVEEEAPAQSPVNRDVSTTVPTPLEKAADRIFKSEDSPGAEAAGSRVDVAAVAPAGLPKDVTPEEVAAIAAAAAQMQMVAKAIQEEHLVPARENSASQVSETQTAATQIAETTSPASIEPASSRAEENISASPSLQVEPVQANSAAAEKEAKPATLADSKESKIESAAGEVAAVEIFRRRKGDASAEETQDVPVTMAATAETVAAASAGASRWTAVSVALEGSEATISLDQEMQKAQAASASAEPASVAPAAAAIASPEPEKISGNEPAMNAAPGEAGPAPVAQLEPAVVASSHSQADAEPVTSAEAAGAVPATAEVAPVERVAEASQAVQFAQPMPEPVAEPVRALEIPEVVEHSPYASQELKSAPEATTGIAETVSASSTSFASVEREAEPAAEPKLDPETVKSTAAAWASWRQVRDTGKGDEAEAQPREYDTPRSAPPDTAAMAVAAGAEQIVQEAAAATAEGESNVASIVDSVLADLRPKLMEEINRKMSKKK
jgi:CheY-like chemotaxis protein